jgi:Ca2+-binding RTX toxin-like protein
VVTPSAGRRVRLTLPYSKEFCVRLPSLSRANVVLAPLVAIGLVLATSGGALADVSGSADVSLSQAVYQSGTGQWWSTTPADPSAPVLIGGAVRLDETLTNNGPDASLVTVGFSMPTDTSRIPSYQLLGTDWGAAPCVFRPGDMPVQCSQQLAAGASWDVQLWVAGFAPGTITVNTWSSGSTPDPDSTNNTATWQATVQCSVMGTPGDDTLTAGPGQSACGLGGNDTLIATPNAIGLYGGDGNDTFILGNAGTVRVLGGDGIDTASYANAPNPVMVCPSDGGGMSSGGMASPDLGGANMSGVENLVGSSFTDWLAGNAGANTITGGTGNDHIVGGRGADTLLGTSGNDLFLGVDHTQDQINGGIGTDKVQADATDHVTSATIVSTEPFTDPCHG